MISNKLKGVKQMTVRELRKALLGYPLDSEVEVEMKINGYEFNVPLQAVYFSGRTFLYGEADDFEVKIEETR